MQRFVLLFVLLVPAVPAHAQQAVVTTYPSAGPFLGGGISYHMLEQESHAPPLCCGERDEWAALGPQIELRAGYLFASFFRLMAEGAYAWLDHSGNVGSQVTTHRIAANLTADFMLTIDRSVLYVGLGGGGAWFSGEGGAVDSDVEESLDAFRPVLLGRVGADVRLHPNLSVGGQFQYYKQLIAEHGFIFTLMATWWPLG